MLDTFIPLGCIERNKGVIVCQSKRLDNLPPCMPWQFQEYDRVNIQCIPILAQLYLYQKNLSKKEEKISWAVGVS